jgi:hypothetical protein
MLRTCSLTIVMSLIALQTFASGCGLSDPAEEGTARADVLSSACSDTLGHALTRAHGRLDGRVYAVVPHSSRRCNGDKSHVHLQVLAGGEIYDVAINTGSNEVEVEAPLLGASWRAGWHPGVGLDYADDLGVHAGELAPTDEAALRADLATADRVAVFMTGYGAGGGHLVHRRGGAADGAVVLDPTGASPRYYLFAFDSQGF